MFLEHEYCFGEVCVVILYMYECKSIFCFTFLNSLPNRILNPLIRCNFSLSCKVCLLSLCVIWCVMYVCVLAERCECRTTERFVLCRGRSGYC